MTTVLLSAGDVSGDLHAADFLRALRRRRPDARALGLGGTELEKAGLELVAHQRELAVGGLFEAAGSLPRVWRTRRALLRAASAARPDLAVLVDSGAFHLPLARRLRARGVPVLYYIAPQVWATRRSRVRKLARRTDRIAVIFPFEPAVYAGTGARVAFVGHPLVHDLEAPAALESAAARTRLGLEPDGPLVLLLPGSRRNELDYVLPLFLETARVLHAADPRVRFALAPAPSLEPAQVQRIVARANLPPTLSIPVRVGRTREAIRAADVVLAKPGTVTVEVMLLGRPLVVAMRGNPLTAALLRRFIHVPSLTMPNLVAGGPVVPEFLQREARPEPVARALRLLLEGPAREAQLARLARVRERLGHGGAAEGAARIAEEMLGSR